MKALSIHQPYASLIRDGEKSIETRYWPTRYTGRLLICSTKSAEYLAGHEREPASPLELPPYPLGMALAVADLVECRPMRPSDEDAACCEWYDGAWSWVLANVTSIPTPVPVRGRQRLWVPPSDVVTLVERQLMRSST